MSTLMKTGSLATISKASAVSAGYYEDKYISELIEPSKRVKRNPLVNRMYYARVWIMRFVIRKFFQNLPGINVQVVNLGGGFDTLYYYIRDNFQNYIYFDIDFPEQLEAKSRLISKSEILTIKNAVFNDSRLLESENFKMIPADLKQVEQLQHQLLSNGFDRAKPTLFISECVLCYLEPNDADRIIKFCNEFTYETSCVVVFEQIEPNDPFGRKLVESFKDWGCPVYIDKYPTVEHHKRRYFDLGWDKHLIYCFRDTYEYIIDSNDKKRIEKLEIFDELEEWYLAIAHYVFSFAYKEVNHILNEMIESLKFQRRASVGFTTEEIRKLISEKKICSHLGSQAYVID